MSARSRKAPVTLLVLLVVLLGPTGADAAGQRLRGQVLAVFDDGSFQLEQGLLVRPTAGAVVGSRGEAFSGVLLVGQPVEAIGEVLPGEETFLARRIEVLAVPGGSLRGEAILEERREDARGILLLADGRRLRVTASTWRDPPDAETSAEDFVPGSYLTYRGEWTDGGEVELTEISFAPNRLEEKEKALQDAFLPKVQLPAGDSAGPAVLRVGKNTYEIHTSPQVQIYLDRLGARLTPALWRDPEAAQRFGLSLRLLLARHAAPRATAFPSGVVVIHTGLLELVENEAQLAFVVAHEVAHVVQEHTWRESAFHGKKLRALRWSTAGIGFLVESAIRRGYQRELESQADRLALWYLAQAGFDPREGVKILQRLEARQEGLSALLWEKHRSYPQRRRALMEELFRYSERGVAYRSLARDSGEFMVLRARIPAARIEAAGEPDRMRR